MGVEILKEVKADPNLRIFYSLTEHASTNK